MIVQFSHHFLPILLPLLLFYILEDFSFYHSRSSVQFFISSIRVLISPAWGGVDSLFLLCETIIFFLILLCFLCGHCFLWLPYSFVFVCVVHVEGVWWSSAAFFRGKTLKKFIRSSVAGRGVIFWPLGFAVQCVGLATAFEPPHPPVAGIDGSFFLVRLGSPPRELGSVSPAVNTPGVM